MICASRRKHSYVKPHDQHYDRQFAELDAHNPSSDATRPVAGLKAREANNVSLASVLDVRAMSEPESWSGHARKRFVNSRTPNQEE